MISKFLTNIKKPSWAILNLSNVFQAITYHQ